MELLPLACVQLRMYANHAQTREAKVRQIFLIGLLLVSAGCDEEATSSSSGNTGQSSPISNVSELQKPNTEPTSETTVIEFTDDDYQQNALKVAEAKLTEMDFPHQERSPSFKTVMVGGVKMLQIRYAHPDPSARAGEWIFHFDPKKAMSENPVNIALHR